MKIEPQPYKLFNHIQNYEWGTKGKDAFIPSLLGFDGEEKPYAELWIGDHPKLSSEILIEGNSYKLNEIVEKYPNEILGISVAEKFGNKLPFLLKVLSAKQALSIQTHPNKIQAIELHKNDSKNYPDNNHKPEIAIALDYLLALVGFRPLSEIENNFNIIPQLTNFIGEADVNSFIQNKTKNGLKTLFETLMNNSSNSKVLERTINSIKKEMEQKRNLTKDENLFLTLYIQYGVDVGLLVMFLLNVVELKAGESIYTPAGIPHAYLKGNIVECMANSDNVVRAGLTPKFKDIAQLTNILTYESGKPELIGNQKSANIREYSVTADEFRVDKILIDNESLEFITDNRIEIILLTEGEISCNNLTIKKGETLLFPALLSKYPITSKSDSTFFRVKVPN